jgi:hypothetical protein
MAFDADAALKIMTSSNQIAQVHEPLATTRKHSASITSTQAGPNALDLWSNFQLMYRWGPLVFTTSEYNKFRARQLRFYYRNLLLWKASRKRSLFAMHKGWLESAAASPTLFHYAYAVAEWPLIRLARKFSRRRTYQFE